MNTKSQGDRGEDIACGFLVGHGFEIVCRNWRTRWCEIDIVALRGKKLHFIEVKSRANDRFGDGLSYVTAIKQQQMRFAAAMYASQHNWEGDQCLAAVSVVAGRVSAVAEIDTE